MDAALRRDPLSPRPPDGLAAGAMLALAVHIALLLALAAGVSWRQRDSETFSAEIWAALPERAAPRPAAPEPAPEPPPPAAATPRAAPPPPAPAPTRSDADIALERARERAAAQEREREAEAQRRRAIEREREAEARRQREAEAALLKQQRELQRQRQAEQARQAEEARRAAALEAQRQANLKRMLGQAGVAGATGSPSATGSAQRDAAPSATYAGRIRASILPNIVLTETLPATLEAVVEVRAAGTGTILSRRLVKSSGNASWDDAVLRAVDRTAKLPRDTDGRVPSSIVISFKPE